MGSWWNSFFMVLQMLTIVFFFWKGVSSHSITIMNDCPFTIWPLFKDGQNLTIANFELPKGSSRAVEAPAHLDAGLVGRTSCQSGYGSREPMCDDEIKPMTSVVFKFRVNETDEYYVDIVNGLNLAVSVDAIGWSGSAVYSCSKAGCIGHVKNWCRPELRVKGGSGCRTACQVFNSPEYCCKQDFATPSTCKPTYYTSAFQRVCPRSRTLPYSTDNNIFTCEGADYIVRFCPTVETFSTIEPGDRLRSTGRLVSRNAAFVLGFHGENYGFLEIWYKDDENKRVWAANLFDPTVSTNGTHALSINPNTGDLVVTIGGTILRSITDLQSGPHPNVMATLGDDGRLRLISKINGTVLWETLFEKINPPGNSTIFIWAPALSVFVAFLLIVICCMYCQLKSTSGREGG